MMSFRGLTVIGTDCSDLCSYSSAVNSRSARLLSYAIYVRREYCNQASYDIASHLLIKWEQQRHAQPLVSTAYAGEGFEEWTALDSIVFSRRFPHSISRGSKRFWQVCGASLHRRYQARYDELTRGALPPPAM